MKKYIAIIILLIAVTAYAFPPTPPTVNITGNAATATALASNPTDCGANAVATAIDASGNLTCSQSVGTIATQNADNVAITGGNVTGITNLGAANATITGGTITGLSALTASTGNVTATAGNFVASTAGKGLDLSANTAFAGGLAAGWIMTDGTIPADNDTVQIDTKTYTFKTALTPTEGEVLINGSAANALINLKAAIMHTGTPDTDYKCAAAHTTVGAYGISTTSLRLRALTGGTAANSYALVVSDANMSVSAATLAGGTAGGTSETFVWYEEGQFTPYYAPLTGDDFAKVTYDIQGGSYIRIGKMVFCHVQLRTDAVDKGTATGSAVMVIQGLPYAGSSLYANYGTVSIGTGFTTTNPSHVAPDSTQTYARLQSGYTATATTVDNIGTGANANYIIVDFAYRVN